MDKHTDRFNDKDIGLPLFHKLMVFESGDRKKDIEINKIDTFNGNALGRFQLGEKALRAVDALVKNGKEVENDKKNPGKDWTGILGKSREEYLHSQNFQEKAFIAYANSVDYILENDNVSRFIGSYINGNKVTYDGLFLNGYHRPGGLANLLDEIDKRYKNNNRNGMHFTTNLQNAVKLPDFDARMAAGLEATIEEEKNRPANSKSDVATLIKVQNNANKNIALKQNENNRNVFHDIVEKIYGNDDLNNVEKYIGSIKNFFTDKLLKNVDKKNINENTVSSKVNKILHKNHHKNLLNKNTIFQKSHNHKLIHQHAPLLGGDESNFSIMHNVIDQGSSFSSAVPEAQPKQAKGPLHVIVLNGRDLADGVGAHLASGLDTPVGGMTGVDPMLSPYGALGGLA